MSNMDKTAEGKEKANSAYQKVMDTVVTLAIGSLVMPTLFLRTFMGIKEGVALIHHLNGLVYFAWLGLVVSAFSAAVYYFLSAKWLKQAYGLPVKISEVRLEKGLDWAFWIAVAALIIGLSLLMAFFLTYTTVYRE